MDGGHVIWQLRHLHARFPTPSDVRALAAVLPRQLASRELYRVFFYHGAPYLSEKIHRRPLDGKPLRVGRYGVADLHQRLLAGLEQSPDFAVRLGDSVYRGWRLGGRAMHRLRSEPGYRVSGSDFIPDFVQKGVDMRIGLDLAALALKRLVDTVVVVTGDADMVPAMRFARREGLRAGVCALGVEVRSELRAHTDFVLDGNNSAARPDGATPPERARE